MDVYVASRQKKIKMFDINEENKISIPLEFTFGMFISVTEQTNFEALKMWACRWFSHFFKVLCFSLTILMFFSSLHVYII